MAAVTSVCGGSESRAPGGSLAGDDAPLAWSIEPIYEIGGASAAAWDAFGAVAAVGFDGAGRLYVLDGVAGKVTVVDRDGGLRHTVGAPGDGPGQFGSPSAMVVNPDGSLVVYDARRRSFMDFEADGAYVGSRPLPADAPAPQGALASLPDGSLLGTGVGAVVPSENDLTGDARPVVVHPPSGAPPRTVYRGWRPPIPTTRALTEDETGGFRVRLPPVIAFHPPLLAVPLRDGRLVVVDSLDYHLRLLAPDGAVVASLRRPIAPTAVTASIRDLERDRRLRLLGDEPPRMEVSDEDGRRAGTAVDLVRRLEEGRIDAMGFQPSIPVIEQIAVDPRDRIWVQRSSGVPGVGGPTDIVTATGEYLGTLAPGTLRTPAAFGPDGLVAHLIDDELGVPVVRVGRLRTGA